MFTYRAWQGKGRQVMRGERGVEITTAVEIEKTDPATGKTETKLAHRRCRVFHECQTKRADDPDPANHAPLPLAPGTPEPAPEPASGPAGARPSATPPAPPRGPRGNPEALRERADAMQPAIDRKIDPAILKQNPTRRRMSIWLSMVAEGCAMQEIQQALRGMADAIEAGTLPECLWGFTYKSHVEDAYYNRCGTTDEQSEAVHALARNQQTPEQRAEQERRAKIQEAEAALVGRDLPGFFPTPPDLARRMVELAEIAEGHEVLEPSAGKGDLADAIREHAPPCELFCIERNHELAEVCKLKGFQTLHGDCLQASGWCDRVVMNPPYEHGQDADHVWHCWEMLNPGCVMVALVSRGLFFRSDMKAQDFRDWLEEEPREYQREDLDDAFNQPGAFRRTGVACTLLVLEKR